MLLLFIPILPVTVNTNQFTLAISDGWSMFDSLIIYTANKRYFIIDQQIARHFLDSSECLYQPLPVYVNQIIYPFLTSRISANHGFELVNLIILYSLMFLYSVESLSCTLSASTNFIDHYAIEIIPIYYKITVF